MRASLLFGMGLRAHARLCTAAGRGAGAVLGVHRHPWVKRAVAAGRRGASSWSAATSRVALA